MYFDLLIIETALQAVCFLLLKIITKIFKKFQIFVFEGLQEIECGLCIFLGFFNMVPT